MPNPPTGKIEADTSRDILESLTASECMLTAKQLAKLLAVSPKTLYSYVSRNLIPHYKIETNVRFRGKDIAEWLRRHTAWHCVENFRDSRGLPQMRVRLSGRHTRWNENLG